MIYNIWKSVEILISRDNPWVGFNKQANSKTEGTWCQNTALLFNMVCEFVTWNNSHTKCTFVKHSARRSHIPKQSHTNLLGTF